MSELAIPNLSDVLHGAYGELRAFALRKLGNRATAEDVVQEACLRFSRLRGEPVDNPRAYLHRIVNNLVIDLRRKERLQASQSEDLERALEVADPAPDSERRLIARQRLELLAEAVAELPPRCRECFNLRRFDGLTQDEIAARMGISRNMVEKHLRLAVAHCAKRLRELD